jgi:hypothetical protein
MVMIIVHDRCPVFDMSKAPLGFDVELDLYFDAFGYIDIYIWKADKII